jgi:hypothetical protein
VRLGVSGAWLQALNGVRGRGATDAWRLWFLGSVIAGSLLAAVLGSWHLHGYLNLQRTVGTVGLVPVLLGGGVLIGYGA